MDKRIYRSIIGLTFTLVLVSASPALAQRTTDKKISQENPAVLRWKILLSSLAQEARTAFPEDRRPYAIVEVANAYWEVDREASRQLYFSALDAALTLSTQDKKYRELLNYVLSAATRRDAGLAKELNKRLVDKAGDKS